MRIALIALFALAAGAANAHPGHVAQSAGHSHWIGVAAIAAAVLVAGVQAVRARARTHFRA